MIISTIVSFINYDVEQRIESPSPRSTAIRIDLAQLGFPYHTTHAGLGLVPNLHISTLTQVPQNMNGLMLPESIVLHLPAPLLADS